MKWLRDSWGTGWLLAHDDYDPSHSLGAKVHVHVCACSAEDMYEHIPADRFCLFAHCNYEQHLGDLPIDMPEDELRAMAIAMWRLK